MDEARAVLRRLDRIERLDRAEAPAAVLLEELRALVAEAEAWTGREGADTEVVERCRSALAQGGVGAPAR